MRTQFDKVLLESNGKWCVSFTTFKGIPGDEYVCAEAVSAPVFDTEDEAFAGAERALNALEKTGRFPNMCEKF